MGRPRTRQTLRKQGGRAGVVEDFILAFKEMALCMGYMHGTAVLDHKSGLRSGKCPQCNGFGINVFLVYDL